MAKKVMVVKKQGALRPATSRDEELFLDLPVGTVMLATLTQPRNLDRHRAYWAVLEEVGDATGNTADALHHMAKVELKEYDLVFLPNGHMYHKFTSTSFDKMDELVFKDYMNRVFAVINEEMGIDIDELRRISQDAMKEVQNANAKPAAR